LIAGAIGVLLLALTSGWWRPQPMLHVTRSTLLPPDGTHFAPLYRNGPPRSLLTGREWFLLPAGREKYLSGCVHSTGWRLSNYRVLRERTFHSGLRTVAPLDLSRTENYGEWMAMAGHPSRFVMLLTPAVELGEPAMRSFWAPMESRYFGFLRQEEPQCPACLADALECGEQLGPLAILPAGRQTLLVFAFPNWRRR